MAVKTNTSTTKQFAGAMANTLNPELNLSAQSGTETPTDNDFAAAMARSGGTYNENSSAKITDKQLAKQVGHDSLETQKQTEAERKKAEILQAHLAPLGKSEQDFIELFNGRKEKDGKDKLAVEKEISDLIASRKEVTIGRNGLETAAKTSLPVSNRSTEKGGGKGWQSSSAKLITWIKQLWKRIKSAKNLNFDATMKTKKEKRINQVKGPEQAKKVHKEMNNFDLAGGE